MIIMSELKILIEGYARKERGGFAVSPSTVLIKESGKKILVDPGLNKKLLNIRIFPNGNVKCWEDPANIECDMKRGVNK